MDSFCLDLPKIELHAHLNGSLSHSILKKLGCSEESIHEYQTVNTTIEDVFKLFDVAYNATNNCERLYIATKEVIDEFAADNVIYLELRTTPRFEENMNENQYIETVIRAIEENKSEKIMVKLLLSINRRYNYKEQAKLLEIIINFKNKHPNLIRGIDLSGDPAKGEFHQDLFEKARQNGLQIAIHCAEIKNDAEVRAIVEFKPDRIGHGTFLHPSYGGSEDIWKKYMSSPIPVECCLSSNVICLTSKSYGQHHVQEWMMNSLPFCIGTDDKGVFQTTLSKEFLHLHEAFNINKSELWDISRRSIDYSFASKGEKQRLVSILEEWKDSNIE